MHDRSLNKSSLDERSEIGKLGVEDLGLGGAADFADGIWSGEELVGEVLAAGGTPAHGGRDGFEGMRVDEPKTRVVRVTLALELQRYKGAGGGLLGRLNCKSTHRRNGDDGRDLCRFA